MRHHHLTATLSAVLIALASVFPYALTRAQGVSIEPAVTPMPLPTMPAQADESTPSAAALEPSSIAAPTPTPQSASSGTTEFVPGVVLVGVAQTAARGGVSTVDALLMQVGGGSAERLFAVPAASDGIAARGVSETDVYRLQLSPGVDVHTAIAALQKSGVAFAEPDYVARAIPVEERGERKEKREERAEATSNDPLVGQQWGLTKINAASAWNVVTGTPATVIAVIDSGIDLEHPDLASRLWVNPGEIAGNGIDDDNNGFVDDVHGWNFVGKSADVADDNGHGTQVAGVAAAAGNNGTGIAGVCWDCRIMVVKAMQPNGAANYSDIAAAVNYAMSKGARVVNLSLGGYADSTALRTAIQAAVGSAVVVAGAGNDATSSRFYPAAYANVLGVAATNGSDAKAGFSNYGDWVSLAAPGEVITTTFLGSAYGPGSGTSVAAPFVAGLAGLIRSQREDWSAALVRQQLLQTAKALSASGLGRGMPDGAKVVQDPKPQLSVASYTVNGETGGRPAAGEPVQLVVNVTNDWLDATGVAATLSSGSVYATIANGSASLGAIGSGETKASGVLSFTVRGDAGYSRELRFTLRLTASEGGYVVNVPLTVTTRSSEEEVAGLILNYDDPDQKELLWTNDKTYVATDNIFIDEGYTLTIQPGTRVQFAGNYTFTVMGTLIADGTEEQPIVFEPRTAGGGWSGLQYRETAPDAAVTNEGVYRGGNILRHVQMRGASSGIRCAATTLLIASVTTDGGGVECTTGKGKSTGGGAAVQGAPAIGESAAKITLGRAHTCALTSGGAVKCWGSNLYGQLGNGGTTSASTPQQVTGLESGVAAIAAGGDHTCVVMSGGGVKCWGANYHGQLGNGETTNARTPQQVTGLESDVIAVAAGVYHTCALTSGGGVKCWGRNDSGQLGNEETEDAGTPQPVSGLESGVVTIVSGSAHTCAMTNGGVKCWGFNGSGQLGNGGTENAVTPQPVLGLESGVVTIVSGAGHICALTSGAGVQCWGDNYFGELGNGQSGSGAFASTPQQVTGLESGVVAITAGNSNFHTCAVTSRGGVKCWGSNYEGQLGNGSYGLDNITSTPWPVTGLESGVVAVAAGGGHTCALTSGGLVKCWGSNSENQLGTGTSDNTMPLPQHVEGFLDSSWIGWLLDSRIMGSVVINGPAVVSNTLIPSRLSVDGSLLLQASSVGEQFVSVTAGGEYTCALTSKGGVKCWGANFAGQLGNGGTADSTAPQHVASLESGVRAVGAGYAHACALTSEGGVKCWGANFNGQLGNGGTADAVIPQQVKELDSGVVAVAAGGGSSLGGGHTCALTSGGAVKCWGRNDAGQLGNGGTMDATTPQQVSGLESGVVEVAAGGGHTCALTSRGAVKCWGGNWFGQLGNGGTTNGITPQQVTGLERDVVAVAASGDHTCALTSGGAVKCWGTNFSGQLGNGGTTDAFTPQQVSGLGSGVVAVAAGRNHTCALTSNGAVKCWGANFAGQMNNGGTTGAFTPQQVSGLGSGVVAVAAGENHTCAVTSIGGVKCWGDGDRQQLGDFGFAGVRVAAGSGSIIRNAAAYGGVNLQQNSLVVDSTIGGDVALGDDSVLMRTTVYGNVSGGRIEMSANTVSSGGVSVDESSTVISNSVDSASGAALTAGANVTVTGNRFVNSGAGIIASSGFFSGNLIANSSGDGFTFGAATVLSNTLVGNGGSAMRVRGGVPLKVAGNNLEGNLGRYDLYVDVPSGSTIAAQNNWWAVTTTSALRARMFDRLDDATKATASFSPTLSGPSLVAPAYVRSVVASPDTVGNEPVTFLVEFSKDMQPEPVPWLTVARAGYSEVLTGTWITSRMASFRTDVTALWPQGQYSITVSAAVGDDGVEIASNSQFTFTVSSANFVSDQTPPSTPQVTALSDGSLTKLTLRWVTTDTESGITSYRYAVGTTPGGTNVVNWTTINAPSGRTMANEFTVVRSGLNLVRGQTYYVSAQARNAGGLWSTAGVSNPAVGGVVTILPTATPVPTPSGSGTPGPASFVVFVPAAWR